jgi:hypothetical protein
VSVFGGRHITRGITYLLFFGLKVIHNRGLASIVEADAHNVVDGLALRSTHLRVPEARESNMYMSSFQCALIYYHTMCSKKSPTRIFTIG